MTAASKHQPAARLSPAMVRCARRELARIERTVKTLSERRAAAQAKVADVDAQIAQCERRRGALTELCGEPAPPVASSGGSVPALRALGGVELRRAAARLLWAQRGGEEIHHREWYERMLAAGYAVNGADPVASFLTNIRGCPAVVGGSAPGHYRLEIEMLDCTRAASAAQRAELGGLEQRVTAGIEERLADGALAEHRRRRDEAATALRRIERHLGELEDVFSATAGQRAAA
jgi:hypothetical protein